MANYAASEIASVLKDAGGELIGRTRLQKLLYFLREAGMGPDLSFEYRHYGPYSEEAVFAAKEAKYEGLIEEEERVANWGGPYSVYRLLQDVEGSPERAEFVRIARDADAVQLELAATALFLAKGGEGSPWEEAERRKPEKASGGGLGRSKALYSKLRAVPGFEDRLPEL